MRCGHRMGWIFCLNRGRRRFERLVPNIERPVKPLGVVVVFVAQLPAQDGRVGLELLDVVEVGAGFQIMDAALVVAESHDDRDAGLVDFVEDLGGCDGLVNADRVDAQVLHEGEVLRQRFEAAGFLSNRDGVVADPLNEVGPFFGEELAMVCPHSGSRFGAGGQGETHQQGDPCNGKRELGHALGTVQVKVSGPIRGGPACRAVRRSCG